MLFAGIDGGQSSTVAVVGDERAALGRGTGPPADLVGEPRDSARQAQALEASLAAALRSAGLQPGTHFARIVAGLSGYDTGVSIAPDLSAYAERVLVTHDADIAHAGALDGAPGIVVIAGTGSVALGNDPGPNSVYLRAGGWGYFFGDEGSALWLARGAVRQAMRRFDAGEESRLGAFALAYFGTDSLRAIQHAFAHGELPRPALASFASDVVACAAEGDADARALTRAAAYELSQLAALVDRRLAPVGEREISYAGGVFRERIFVDDFAAALASVLPCARLQAPVNDAAGGALALARKLA